MYYPQQPPKEPSGCLQTLVISRAIIGLLMVPIGMMTGAIVALILVFYAFTVHPILGVFALALLIGSGYYGIMKWEEHRAREISRPRDQ